MIARFVKAQENVPTVAVKVTMNARPALAQAFAMSAMALA